MTTTLRLTDEQAKLLVDVLASAPDDFQMEMERRDEIVYYEDQEMIDEDDQRLKDLKALRDDLTGQLLAGPADVEKKILEVLPVDRWMQPDELVTATLTSWHRLVHVLEELQAKNIVRASGLGYIQVS